MKMSRLLAGRGGARVCMRACGWAGQADGDGARIALGASATRFRRFTSSTSKAAPPSAGVTGRASDGDTPWARLRYGLATPCPALPGRTA